MAEPFLGQIISVGFNFAPLGWALCNGAPLSIAEYPALFQLLGTVYGGDGISTFNVPNLNGRVPLGQGQGQGLSPYVQGQQMGVEQVTLISGNTPSHSHTVSFSQVGATLDSAKPVGGKNVAMAANSLGVLKGFYLAGSAGTVALKGDAITLAGGSGIPHENRQQYLVLNYIIATAGIFPSQT